MRVTSSGLMESMVRHIQDTSSRLMEMQRQLASGKRITRVSDDPSGLLTALSLRSHLREGRQAQGTLDNALGWLEATERGLLELQDNLMRARQLALAAGSASAGAEALEAAGREVDQIMRAAADAGNTRYINEYVFGGLKTTTPPFQVTGSPLATVTYTGDNGAVVRSLGTAGAVTLNSDLTGAFPQLLNTLAGLRDDLLARDADSVRTTRVAELDQRLTTLSATLAEVGAKMRHLHTLQDHLEQGGTRVQSVLSRVEDVDMAEAALEMARAEATYQAVLALTARALHPGLVAYLR